MNHVRKLALHGMRGRRKDTRVLALVIVMSFLFLTAGTLLLSSFSGSQARQRQSLYGGWHLLYGGGDSRVAESLTGLSQVAETAEVTLLGVDGQCGQVAAWSEDFARMGSLQIVEGRAPEAAGEILLERGQLGLFPEETGVGSTVTLTLEHHLTQLRGRQLPSGTMTIRGEEVPAKTVIRAFGDGATEASIQAIMERLWREEVWSIYSTYIDENGEEQRELWFPDTATHCPVSEMDDETYRSTLLAVCNCWGAALNDYYKYQLGTGRDALVEVDRTFVDSGVPGAVSWGLNTNYEQLYAKGVELDEAELRQMILDRGAVPAQDLTLTRTCTVVGIVETVSDRWDVGDTALPNCYLSEATAGELRDTLSYLETKDAPRLYRLPEEQKLLFLRGSGTVAGLYGQVLETELPRVREISENQYYRLLENEWGLAGYGHEATEWDLNLAREQWAEEQAKDPSLAGISLVDLEVDSSRYGGVWMEKENLLGSSYRREVYFHVPVFRWEMSDGSTRLEEGQIAYLMLPQYSSDSASVVSAYYSAREVPYQELLDGTAQVDSGEGIYASASWELPDLTEGYTYNQGQVLLNRYGYPREGGLTGTMGAAMIGVIVTITVCAVFQISFIQLRRRARRLTLLRSVGATNGQMFELLAWECAYITLGSLILGDVLGVAVAWGVTGALEEVSLFLSWPLVLAGQACGLLAVAFGMLMPSLRAMKAPLVGRMEGRKGRHVKVKPMKRQTWRRLRARDRAANPGRTVGMAALCTFLVTMELICVFLGNAAFDTYRQTVVQADQPDYTLLSNHTGSSREVAALQEALGRAEGLSRVDFWQREDHIFLWYEGMDRSPVLSALKQAGGSGFFASSEAESAQKEGEAFLTQAYGVDETSGLFARLEAALTEGNVDPAAFEAGQEVILLLPMYRPLQGSGAGKEDSMAQFLRSSGAMDLSLAASAGEMWEADRSVQVGDVLTLAVDCPHVTDSSAYYTQTVREVTVGAIIRYFPEQGVWPFAGDPQSHVVIGSSKLLYSLYSDGFKTMTYEEKVGLQMRKDWLYAYNYGEAGFSLYAGEGATTENTLTPLFQISREYYLTLGNLRDSNQAIYNKALSSCLLMGLLAFAATVIVWMILSNTLVSAQEQGRRRTGILQALGVTKAQLYRGQALQALRDWLIALVGSHGILALVVLAAGWVQRWDQGLAFRQLLLAVAREDLAAYPWLLHLGLCLLELPVLLWFHLRALDKPLQASPIENIRS